MKHSGTKTLETKRLILREFFLSDIDNMHKNWVKDEDVTKYLTWKPHKDKKETEETLRDWISSYKNDDFYQWAIVLKDINEVIGSISVVRQNDDIKMVHIGYCIGKQYWKKGITSEALFQVIKFFFEEVGVNKVESMHNVANVNSGKVMQKCGMKVDGILRQSEKDNSGIYDAKYYSILKNEYFENKNQELL